MEETIESVCYDYVNEKHYRGWTEQSRASFMI